MRRETGTKWYVAGGSVLAAWLLLIALENVVVDVAWSAFFAGSWEMAAARTRVSPIALAALLPAAMVMPQVGRLLGRADEGVRPRRLVAVAAAILGGALAYGVSFG